jgi:hypothetical protein
MFVSQFVSDAAIQPARRQDGSFGPHRDEHRGAGLRARLVGGWRKMTAGEAPQRVACADCAA